MKHLGPVPGWHGYSPKSIKGGLMLFSARSTLPEPLGDDVGFKAMLTRQARDIEARRRLKR